MGMQVANSCIFGPLHQRLSKAVSQYKFPGEKVVAVFLL